MKYNLAQLFRMTSFVLITSINHEPIFRYYAAPSHVTISRQHIRVLCVVSGE